MNWTQGSGAQCRGSAWRNTFVSLQDTDIIYDCEIGWIYQESGYRQSRSLKAKPWDPLAWEGWGDEAFSKGEGTAREGGGKP